MCHSFCLTDRPWDVVRLSNKRSGTPNVNLITFIHCHAKTLPHKQNQNANLGIHFSVSSVQCPFGFFRNILETLRIAGCASSKEAYRQASDCEWFGEVVESCCSNTWTWLTFRFLRKICWICRSRCATCNILARPLECHSTIHPYIRHVPLSPLTPKSPSFSTFPNSTKPLQRVSDPITAKFGFQIGQQTSPGSWLPQNTHFWNSRVMFGAVLAHKARATKCWRQIVGGRLQRHIVGGQTSRRLMLRPCRCLVAYKPCPAMTPENPLNSKNINLIGVPWKWTWFSKVRRHARLCSIRKRTSISHSHERGEANLGIKWPG